MAKSTEEHSRKNRSSALKFTEQMERQKSVTGYLTLLSSSCRRQVEYTFRNLFLSQTGITQVPVCVKPFFSLYVDVCFVNIQDIFPPSVDSLSIHSTML